MANPVRVTAPIGIKLRAEKKKYQPNTDVICMSIHNYERTMRMELNVLIS